jgi:hypothetical protein
MNDIEEILDNKSFKEEFWVWWDKQPKEFRDLYNYHKSDMSMLYYYNKIYVKKKGP